MAADEDPDGACVARAVAVQGVEDHAGLAERLGRLARASRLGHDPTEGQQGGGQVGLFLGPGPGGGGQAPTDGQRLAIATDRGLLRIDLLGQGRDLVVGRGQRGHRSAVGPGA